MTQKEYIEPENCPLCGQPNHCGNLLTQQSVCWCMDKNISFSKALLNQVSSTMKNKACICKACALKFALNGSKP